MHACRRIAFRGHGFTGAGTRPGRKRARFTLIELLVVVAIIAVLAALLFPGLQRAKESAIAMSCKSNMKQIGSAFLMYADDNGQYFPPCSKSFSSLTWNGVTRTGPWVKWNSAMYVGQYVGNTNISSTAFPDAGRCSTRALYCPKWYNGWNWSSGSKENTGIGYNNLVSFSLPIHRAANASKLLTLIDTPNYWAFNSFSVTGQYPPSYRHNRSANATFMDGHVEASDNWLAKVNSGQVNYQIKE